MLSRIAAMFNQPAPYNKKEFLRLLNEALSNSGWSQAELAARSNIDHSYLSLILHGKRHPERDIAIRICWYGLSLDSVDGERILKAGGYKTLVNWEKAGWDQESI